MHTLVSAYNNKERIIKLNFQVNLLLCQLKEINKSLKS